MPYYYPEALGIRYAAYSALHGTRAAYSTLTKSTLHKVCTTCAAPTAQKWAQEVDRSFRPIEAQVRLRHGNFRHKASWLY